MNRLTPEMAREMDRCDKVPPSLTYEHAHGIVVVHRDKGACTYTSCPRLAAALERIRIAEQAQ
ncbi:hypothetical protein [Nocardia sp. NPDC050412]|uniref:hypothetical protein n=1 Tax=Nocardia sp. NPDC050412 TaxID=3364320 RepID=UPI0037928E1C